MKEIEEFTNQLDTWPWMGDTFLFRAYGSGPEGATTTATLSRQRNMPISTIERLWIRPPIMINLTTQGQFSSLQLKDRAASSNWDNSHRAVLHYTGASFLEILTLQLRPERLNTSRDAHVPNPIAISLSSLLNVSYSGSGFWLGATYTHTYTA